MIAVFFASVIRYIGNHMLGRPAPFMKGVRSGLKQIARDFCRLITEGKPDRYPPPPG